MPRIVLLAALLLAAAPAFAQSFGRHARPDSNDNTLILTLPEEGLAAWQRAGRLLARRGYPIRYASPELLTLSTEPLDVDHIGAMGMLVAVEGHELRLSALVPTGEKDSGAMWFGVPDQGGFLGGASRYWPELEAVARLLGGSIEYTRSVGD